MLQVLSYEDGHHEISEEHMQDGSACNGKILFPSTEMDFISINVLIRN